MCLSVSLINHAIRFIVCKKKTQWIEGAICSEPIRVQFESPLSTLSFYLMPNADGGHGFMYGYKNLLDLGLGLEKLFLEKKKALRNSL